MKKIFYHLLMMKGCNLQNDFLLTPAVSSYFYTAWYNHENIIITWENHVPTVQTIKIVLLKLNILRLSSNIQSLVDQPNTIPQQPNKSI